MSVKPKFEIIHYPFNSDLIPLLNAPSFPGKRWPVLYVLRENSGKKPRAYIGETTNASNRMKKHLRDERKRGMKTATFIYNKRFNKSVTLELESRLIEYFGGDGKYGLLNGNLGLAHHNYFQKDEDYQNFFQSLWQELLDNGIVKYPFLAVFNSPLFKHSPFKGLSDDQKKNLILILQSLLGKEHRNIVIEGVSGTGKSLLAVFLFKLLHTPIEEFNYTNFGSNEQEIFQLVQQLKEKYPHPKAALVIPMDSFRSTIKSVFGQVPGLCRDMVIGPAEVIKEKYDFLIVDEAHRLRRPVMLGQYHNRFKEVCAWLKRPLDKTTELDWMLMRSRKTILFYDEFQSIRPSDVLQEDFDRLKNKRATKVEYLTTQHRVLGGNQYETFIHQLLTDNLPKTQKVFKKIKGFEFCLFHDIEQFRKQIAIKEDNEELARMVAGYGWPWVSKKNKRKFDINLSPLKFRWNSITKNWIYTLNAPNEVGCIHTVQGADLNYAGVIFGPEIGYDEEKKEIIIRKENYHDRNGKATVKDPKQLKAFVINIYKTLMLRGIKGTYLYICDDALRRHFAQYIPGFKERPASKQPV